MKQLTIIRHVKFRHTNGQLETGKYIYMTSPEEEEWDTKASQS
jgi:hypothetical protein